MSTVIKNISTVVTCDDKDQVFDNIDIKIEEGIITEIGECLEGDEVIDGKNKILYPGLVNTHHHFYQMFTRNLPQVQNMELFPWLKTLYEIWKNLERDTIYNSSLAAMGELMKHGCTTAFDHHYVFPKDGVGFIEAQFEAAKDLGMRFTASRGSMDLSVKDGGLPPDTVVQSVDEILKDSQRLIEKYHNKNDMQGIVLAPCSPFSVTGDLMRESALLAREYGARLHTHLAETKDEETFTLEKFGMRPLEYMDSLGWLGSDVWYAHGIHFNKEELKVLAQTKTGVCHCPISNMKLSSGVARISEMLELGVPVALGVDGSASNDGSNLLEEIRASFLLHRLHSSEKAPTGYDILKIATRGGAKVLGREDIGSIEVGKKADLFMIQKSQLGLAGALEDPKSFLGTVGYTGEVDISMINGEVVVEKGRLVKIDEEKITEKVFLSAEKLLTAL